MLTVKMVSVRVTIMVVLQWAKILQPSKEKHNEDLKKQTCSHKQQAGKKKEKAGTPTGTNVEELQQVKHHRQ